MQQNLHISRCRCASQRQLPAGGNLRDLQLPSSRERSTLKPSWERFFTWWDWRNWFLCSKLKFLIFALSTGRCRVMHVNECSDTNQDSPLSFAAARHHNDLARFLISRGANVNHQNKKGLCSLLYNGSWLLALGQVKEKLWFNVSVVLVIWRRTCWLVRKVHSRFATDIKSRWKHKSKQNNTPVVLSRIYSPSLGCEWRSCERRFVAARRRRRHGSHDLSWKRNSFDAGLFPRQNGQWSGF